MPARLQALATSPTRNPGGDVPRAVAGSKVEATARITLVGPLMLPAATMLSEPLTEAVGIPVASTSATLGSGGRGTVTVSTVAAAATEWARSAVPVGGTAV